MHILPHFRIKNDDTSLCEWKKIFHSRPHKKYKKRAVIVGQGQLVTSLYFIVYGIVAYISTNETGKEHIIDVLGKGNIICMQSVFGKTPTSGAFIALTDSALSIVTARELKGYLNNNALVGELLEEMAQIACGLIRQLHSYTMSAGQRGLPFCSVCLQKNRNKKTTLRFSCVFRKMIWPASPGPHV